MYIPVLNLDLTVGLSVAICYVISEISNYSGGCKAKYRTLLEGVWFSDIGRMAEVRNVPHLARCE